MSRGCQKNRPRLLKKSFLHVILNDSEESSWLNPNITAFKRDPSSPAAPQDDIYGTFSVISNRSLDTLYSSSEYSREGVMKMNTSSIPAAKPPTCAQKAIWAPELPANVSTAPDHNWEPAQKPR